VPPNRHAAESQYTRSPSALREAAHRARAARWRLARRFHLGVLDRLLAEPNLEIVGTSAGAMNAGVLADGLRRGGASQARLALREYWQDVGRLPGYGSFWSLVPQRTWHLDHHTIYLWADMLTRVWSPYQTNCSNYHPLRELLQDVDFGGLRDDVSAPRVFICATNVRTGLRRVFDNAELLERLLRVSPVIMTGLTTD
jgi:NTE family protein